jgi:sterol 3beta-glucosyltransferase
VVEKPDELTKIIFGAVKRAGVRAIVSKGWGGLGDGEAPKDTFLLGNCPHDWLFQYVSCVVHHGGAGTTAISIAMGKPTLVVPFFGDQPFWGAMIYRAGAGPEPVPYKNLTEEKLAEGIIRALKPDIQCSVREISEKMAGDNGSADAAASFHSSLNYDDMRCMLCPDHVAVWRVKRTNLRLSSLATAVLADNGLLTLRHLELYSPSSHTHLRILTEAEFGIETGILTKERVAPSPGS